MEKIKWPVKLTNEQVLDRIGKKRTVLNNILRRKANWIGPYSEKNYAIEGQMTELKGVGRRTRSLIMRNRRKYSELKEEAEDRKSWRRLFINPT